MSDVLIRDCDIGNPKRCLECRFCYIWRDYSETIEVECVLTHSRHKFKKDGKRKAAIDCPLVEVPPHGRLIDADAHREEFMEFVYTELQDDADNCRANRIIDFFDTLPTALEASE